MFKDLFCEDFKKGTFVAVFPDVESKKIITDFREKYLPDIKPETEPHITMIYSNVKTEPDTKNKQYKIKVTGYDIFNGYLVALVECNELKARQKELISEYGYTSDFSKYRPHITLGISKTIPDIPLLPDLIFGNETAEEAKK